MTSINIYGMYSLNGVPVLDVLLVHHTNENHTNLLEIARPYYNMAPEKYAAIIVCFDGTENIHVYNWQSFRTT